MKRMRAGMSDRLAEIHSTFPELEALMEQVNKMSADELKIEIFKLGRQCVDFRRSLLTELEALRSENEKLKADLKWIKVCAEDMFQEGDKGFQIAIFAKEAEECPAYTRGEPPHRNCILR